VHNNTFRMLRVIDPSAPVGNRNLKLIEYVHPALTRFDSILLLIIHPALTASCCL
jgi:hypothetical protein